MARIIRDKGGHEWELTNEVLDESSGRMIRTKTFAFECKRCGSAVWPSAINYSSRVGEMRKQGILEDCPAETIRRIMES